MIKVYLHRKGMPDKHIGSVSEDGKVYRRENGKEQKIGYVELTTGKIFISVTEPGTYAGKVKLDSAKVFRHVPNAMDEYLGEVKKDGKMYRHVAAFPDKYIGNVSEYISNAHSGAAFLLLVYPAEQA